MAKYFRDFKHKVVQGYNAIYHHFSVIHSVIKKWVEQYQKHGLDGFAVQSSRTIFSIEFNIHSVQMILERMSFQKARRQLNLSDLSLLDRWVQQDQAHDIEDLKPNLKECQNHMVNLIKLKKNLYSD